MSDSEKEDETPIQFAPPSDNDSDDDGLPARPQPTALGALSALAKTPVLPTPRKSMLIDHLLAIDSSLIH